MSEFASVEPRRGQIWYANMSFGEFAAKKFRPVVILSNDKNNEHSGYVTAAPLTTRLDRPLPTHVIIPPSQVNGLTAVSVVKAESLTVLPKSDLSGKAGDLPEHLLRAVEDAVKIQLGLATAEERKESE